MTKRLTLSLAAIVVLFLLTASAQKPHSPQQLAVYDVDGKKVGVVSGGDYIFGGFEPLVPFKIDDVPMMLLVFREGLVAQTQVVWESTDCSGIPFIDFAVADYRNSPSSLPLVAVGVPGSTVYVENGPARSIIIGSFSTIPLNTPRGVPPLPSQCAQTGFVSGIRTSVPARALIDMNTLFKPPFTVR